MEPVGFGGKKEVEVVLEEGKDEEEVFDWNRTLIDALGA